MTLRSSNKIDTNRYELEIAVDAAEFEKQLEKSYKKQVNKISIPGFRKGKAPRAFIEKYYGKEIFYEDAINAIYPDALDEAVAEAKIDVVDDKIDFDLVEAGENGLVFKVKLTVKPEVAIDNYKGLEVKVENREVTDQDINDEIERIRDRNARMIPVEDREAKMGDTAIIDFEGFCDGVAFEGGKAEKYSLTLGEGHFIKGFEEQVAGHKIGEEFDVNVTFPEEYQAKDLAGKDAVFKVKLHEIKEKELPKLDDEFVKDVSEFDNLEDYKNDIKAKLKEQNQKRAEDETENQIVDKLIELVKAEIPEAMYKNKIKDIARDFEYRLRSQGLDVKSYMKYTGMDNDKFMDSFRPQAERQVKIRLALEKIADLENLEATEDNIEDEYKKIADQYNMEIENVKNIVPKKELIQDILVEKAMKLVRENSVLS